MVCNYLGEEENSDSTWLLARPKWIHPRSSKWSKYFKAEGKQSLEAQPWGAIDSAQREAQVTCREKRQGSGWSRQPRAEGAGGVWRCKAAPSGLESGARRAAGVLRERNPSQPCLNALLSCPISHPCAMVSLNSTENEVNSSGKTSKRIKEEDASWRVPGQPTAPPACQGHLQHRGWLGSFGVCSSKGTQEQREDVLGLCCCAFPLRSLQDAMD